MNSISKNVILLKTEQILLNRLPGQLHCNPINRNSFLTNNRLVFNLQKDLDEMHGNMNKTKNGANANLYSRSGRLYIEESARRLNEIISFEGKKSTLRKPIIGNTERNKIVLKMNTDVLAILNTNYKLYKDSLLSDAVDLSLTNCSNPMQISTVSFKKTKKREMKNSILGRSILDYQHRNERSKLVTSQNFVRKLMLSTIGANYDLTSNNIIAEENPIIVKKLQIESHSLQKKEISREIRKPRIGSRERRNLTMIKPRVEKWDYSTNLERHPINNAIRLINNFTATWIKCRKNHLENIIPINILGKALGLNISKSQMKTSDFLRNKQLMSEINDQMLKKLYEILNKENDIANKKINGTNCSKVYLCNGNNPAIVRSVLQQRYWWSITDSIETANLIWTQWKKLNLIKSLPCNLFNPMKLKVCNHVEGGAQLGNKKALFYNLKAYYECLGKNPFDYIPLTFHISKGLIDPQFDSFKEVFEDMKQIENQENVWIIKPGENSNRGTGIMICKTLGKIKEIISHPANSTGTYIVQKYIEKPLLFNNRKFDIRCYGLITAYNGFVKGYFYNEGYLRTSSREFSLKNLSAKIIHLTNEAIQQKYDEFSKFEPGNKVRYIDFERYLKLNYSKKNISFYDDFLPKIKNLVGDTMN